MLNSLSKAIGNPAKSKGLFDGERALGRSSRVASLHPSVYLGFIHQVEAGATGIQPLCSLQPQ